MAHATTPILPAFSRSVRRGAAAFARWLARARSGDEKGIHQARVATRRLREAMPLLIAAGHPEAHGVLRDLRRLTRALGPVREMDVARSVLQELARQHQWPPSIVSRADRHCAEVRTRRMDAFLDRADRIEASTVARRVIEMLAPGPGLAAPDVVVFLTPRLRRRARALAEAIDRAGTLYAPKPLHEVRLAAKKLRYVLELGGAATGTGVAREIRPLKSLQTLLGHLHDLQVVQGSLQEALAGRTLERGRERRFAQMDQDVETHCRELHARYVRLAPAARDRAQALARDASFRFRRRGRMIKMALAEDARGALRARG